MPDEEAAVRLAMEGRWEAAVEVNRRIIARSPRSLSAYNRLGRALAALGRLQEARDAYQAARRVEPRDPIAARNLSRLGETAPGPPAGVLPGRPSADFATDPGRTTLVRLGGPGQAGAGLMPGDQVVLSLEADQVVAIAPDGARLGAVTGGVAARLARLMRAGNRYEARLAASEGGPLVAIREVYRSPAAAERPTFLHPAGRAIDYGRLERGEPAESVDLEELMEPYQEYEPELPEEESAWRLEASAEHMVEEAMEEREGAVSPELLEEESEQEERDRALAAEEEADER